MQGFFKIKTIQGNIVWVKALDVIAIEDVTGTNTVKIWAGLVCFTASETNSAEIIQLLQRSNSYRAN